MTMSAGAREDDRVEWDRLWSGRTARQLRRPFNLGVRIDPRFGDLVSVTIAQAPAELWNRLWFETPLCPICGESSLTAPRLAAQLTLAFASGFVYGLSV
jgi:hypothetical protein